MVYKLILITMYLFKRKSKMPTFELHQEDGSVAPLHVTFKDGEIHLNPNFMAKGKYELMIQRGAERESRLITVQ